MDKALPAPSEPAAAKPMAQAPEKAAAARKALGALHWPAEFGGPKGPEPTRYGDWERNGRVSDF
jgi:hypothetical protein